ncbi:amidohydrolase [Lacrimispora sp.]|uniref:amidohydrolase n=1 Tax=Lacrimispora sp. TaxID=2719234 RepID=UPI0028A5C179|nr:amidohydrolase [Lacrimispora sp.]
MKDIYYNAVIFVQMGLEAEAMGVEHGRIVFVGTLSEARIWDDKKQAIWHDLKGAFVVPGFNDSHLHLLQYGHGLSCPDLSKHTSSIKDIVEVLHNFRQVKQDKPGAWLILRGWNQESFNGDKRMPTRHDLDQVSKEQPILIYRSCGHIACANSAALHIAGITRETKNPEGGSIDFDEALEPSGILREYAINLVSEKVPPPDKVEIKADIIRAMKQLNAYGITSVQSDDFGAFPGLSYETVMEVYKELEVEGALTVKVYEQCLLSDKKDLEDFIEKGYKTGKGSSFFTIGPLKLIGDGSLGARTACLSTPYADDELYPENCGISVYSQSELDGRVSYGADHGMQIAIHAIGDKAMEMAVHSIKRALKGNKDNSMRHGIVHCQITTKELIKTFQELNLHAYVQTIFMDHDNHVVEKRVGRERAADTYAFKTLLDLGIHVSNGSDAPVEEPDVLSGIQCAVTRTTLDGIKTFLPEQSITVEEALHTFTSMSARASFEENEKGTLLPGMAADFTVLSQDIRTCNPKIIREVAVCQTFVNGICVYDSLA